MKEQIKKFSNKFQPSSNNLNNNQTNKVIINYSELEKINSSNKNDLSGNKNNKNQKEIKNRNNNEVRPKSPSCKHIYLNSNNLKRLEINENNIHESNDTNTSKEKRIYFYFKKNFQNSTILNRRNYSPQISSRKREVIIDYLNSEFL